MACDKWIIRWEHPLTGRYGQKTFRNEDKALSYIMKQIKKGLIVEDEFFPCGGGKNGS